MEEQTKEKVSHLLQSLSALRAERRVLQDAVVGSAHVARWWSQSHRLTSWSS